MVLETVEFEKNYGLVLDMLLYSLHSDNSSMIVPSLLAFRRKMRTKTGRS